MITVVHDAGNDDRIYGAWAHARALAAMREIADGLADQGMDILGQEWEEAHYLKASNIWGAWCEATVGANGKLTWEYRPADGRWTDPDQVAVMAVHLIGAAGIAELAPPIVRFPGQSVKAAAGLRARSAQACGLP